MIVGIGIDLVNIDRIADVLQRHGERFLNRVYTEGEQNVALRMKDHFGSLAKRWAAKEACSKALGTGMKQGVAWRDIEITNQIGGMPTLFLKGKALQRLLAIVPPGHVPILHLTMTDDQPSAAAHVIIEATPQSSHYSPKKSIS